MLPRPATVLVLGTRAEVITRRETVEDLLQRARIPEWLTTEGSPSPVMSDLGGVAWPPLPSWARPRTPPACPRRVTDWRRRRGGWKLQAEVHQGHAVDIGETEAA